MQRPSLDGWRWASRAAVCAALAALLLATALSWLLVFHARPAADDFTVAVGGRELGAAGYADSIYATKSGRWAGHALLALVLGRVDLERAYPWLLAALLLVQLGASAAFLRALLGDGVPRGRALLLVLGLQALLWCGRPVPEQTLYWFAGAVPYQFSVSCALFLVAGLLACSRRGRVGPPAWVAFALGPAFVAGLQEVVAMMLAVLLLVAAAVAWRRALPGRGAWLVSTVSVLVGLAANLRAPGNAVRAGDYPEGGDVVVTLTALAQDLGLVVREWVLDPRLLAASLFLWLSPAFHALRPRWVPAGPRWAGLVGATAAAALTVGLAAPRWATGTWQPPRMLASDYVLFLHAWFAVLLLAARGPGGTPDSTPRARLRVLALLALALTVPLTGNGRLALADLASGRLRRFGAVMEERARLVRRAAEGGRALVLPRSPYPPRMLVRMDVQEDPRDWVNRAVARYYGLPSIAMEPRPPAR
jgi:hypothetical protein